MKYLSFAYGMDIFIKYSVKNEVMKLFFLTRRNSNPSYNEFVCNISVLFTVKYKDGFKMVLFQVRQDPRGYCQSTSGSSAQPILCQDWQQQLNELTHLVQVSVLPLVSVGFLSILWSCPSSLCGSQLAYQTLFKLLYGTLGGWPVPKSGNILYASTGLIHCISRHVLLSNLIKCPLQLYIISVTQNEVLKQHHVLTATDQQF